MSLSSRAVPGPDTESEDAYVDGDSFTAYNLLSYLWKNHIGLIDDDTANPDSYVHIVGSAPVLDALEYLSLDRKGLLSLCKQLGQWCGTQNDLISPKCEIIVKHAECEMHDNYNVMGWIVQTKFSTEPHNVIKKCSDSPFHNMTEFHMFKNAILVNETTPGIVVVDDACELVCHGRFFVQLVPNAEHRLEISDLGVCSVLGDTAVGVYRILKRLPCDSLCICVGPTYSVQIVTKLLSLFKGDMFNGSPTFTRFIVPSAVKHAVNLVSLEMCSVYMPRDIAVVPDYVADVAVPIRPLLRCEMLRYMGSPDDSCPIFVAVHMFDAVAVAFPKPDVCLYFTPQDNVHFEEKLLSYCDIVCRSFCKRSGAKDRTLQFCSVTTQDEDKTFARTGVMPNRFIVRFSYAVECVQVDLNKRVIYVPEGVETTSCALSLLTLLDCVCYLFETHVSVVVMSRSDMFCKSMIRAFNVDSPSAASYTVCVQCDRPVSVMGLPGMRRGGMFHTLPDWSVDCVPVDMFYVKEANVAVSDLLAQELPMEEPEAPAAELEEDMAELIGLMGNVQLMGPAITVSETPVTQFVMSETSCKASQFTDNMYGSLQPHILKATFIFCDYAINRELEVFLAYVPKPHMRFLYYSSWYVDVFGDDVDHVAKAVGEECWEELISCCDSIPYTNTVAVINKSDVLTHTLSVGDFGSSFLIERERDERQIPFMTPREKVLADENFLSPLQDKNLYHMVLCVTFSPIGLKLIPQTPKLNLHVRQAPEDSMCTTTPGLRCPQRPLQKNTYLKASYDEACYLGWRSTWKPSTAGAGNECCEDAELTYTVSDVLKLFYEIVHPDVERLRVGSVVSSYELKPVYCERRHTYEFKNLMAFLSVTTDVIALSQNVYMAYRQTGASSVKLKDFLCPAPKANLVMLLMTMNEAGAAPLISRMLNPADIHDVECPYYTKWIDTVLSAYSKIFGPVYVFKKEDWGADSSVGRLDMYRLTDVVPYNRSKKDVYVNHSVNIKRFMFCGISPMLYLRGVGPLIHSPVDRLPVVVDNVHFRTNVELLKENNTEILWPDPDPLSLSLDCLRDDDDAGDGDNCKVQLMVNGIKDPSSEAFCPKLPPPPPNQADLTVGFGPEVAPKLFAITTVLSEDERTWEVPVRNLVRDADFAKLGTGPEVPFSGLSHDIGVVKKMDYRCTVTSRPLSTAFTRFTNRIVTNGSESVWTTGLTKVVVRTISGPLCPFYRRRDVGLVVIPVAGAHVSMPALGDHPFGVDTVIRGEDLIPVVLKNLLTYAKVYIRCERKGQTMTIQKILAAAAIVVGCNSKLVVLSTPEGPGLWLQATYGIMPNTQKDVEIIQQGNYVGFKVNFTQATLKASFTHSTVRIGIKESLGLNMSTNNYTVVFHETQKEYDLAMALKTFTPRTVHHICMSDSTWLKDPHDILNKLIQYKTASNVNLVSKLTLSDVVPLHVSGSEAEKYIEKYVSASIACDGAIMDNYVELNVSEDYFVSTLTTKCDLAMADNGFLDKNFVDLVDQVTAETEKAILSVDVFTGSVYPPKYKQYAIQCRALYNHNDMTALHVGGLEFDFAITDAVGGIVIENTDSACGTVIMSDGTLSIRVNVTEPLDLWKAILAVCNVGGPFICLSLNYSTAGDPRNMYSLLVCKLLSCMHVISKRKPLPFSKVRILARKALINDFVENMLRHFICYNDTCYVFKQSFDHLNMDVAARPKMTFTLPKNISYTKLMDIKNIVCYELPEVAKREEFLDVKNGLWITIVIFIISQGLYVPSESSIVDDIITLYRTYKNTVTIIVS